MIISDHDHHYLGLALEVAHVPVVEVLELPSPGEHGVGAVTVAAGADAGHVVTLQPDDAALEWGWSLFGSDMSSRSFSVGFKMLLLYLFLF